MIRDMGAKTHATHGFRGAPAALATLALLAMAASAAAEPQNRGTSEPGNLGRREPWDAGTVDVEGRIPRSRFRHLATRSTTMKQMLAVLGLRPAISVRLRSQPTLARKSQRHGLGSLLVDGARIRAVLEFDTWSATPLQQLEAVAHEIAHVVEVACLPSITGAGQLRSVLLGRGFGQRNARGVITIETPFAVDAGRTVVSEMLSGGKDPGMLGALARRYDLRSPCADHPGPAAVASPAAGR
jgi:hypothetical protein